MVWFRQGRGRDARLEVEEKKKRGDGFVCVSSRPFLTVRVSLALHERKKRVGLLN